MQVHLTVLGPPPGDGIGTPRTASEAAEQFEALLLGQLLRAARPSEEPEDVALETMWDLAAQQFAQVLAHNGGVGLARMIRAQLDRGAEAGLQSRD
jgi:Rod binding domain-containing protein